MKLQTIYLDTSVINFLFADDAPELKEITIDFFDNFIRPMRYDTFISRFVIAEIEDMLNEEKKNKLLKVVDDYRLELLELHDIDEIQFLADKYVEAGIIPVKKINDAYHIAVSVINQIDYLVSWNYKHLANVKKERLIHLVNLANNYTHEIRIITPLELIDYGNENI
jgi:predicted nucleic acid-binding protein